MTRPHVERTRTPPDLKWLLNERAALAGEISKAFTRRNALEARLAKTQRQLMELKAALEGANRALATSQTSSQALDATLEMAYSTVDPGAAGVVQAWAGKYGKRGGLKDFLLKTLRDAAPTPVTTTVLIQLAINHFGLVFKTPQERALFRFPVRNTLRILVNKGVVETLHDPLQNRAAVWRIKPPTSFADIAAKAERMAKAAAEARNARATDSNPS